MSSLNNMKSVCRIGLKFLEMLKGRLLGFYRNNLHFWIYILSKFYLGNFGGNYLKNCING